jgi:hypothetical protein
MSKSILYAFFVIFLCGAIVAMYFLNPIDYIWMPKCPTKMIFGINCPGCGLQRAAHALLHGHIKEAIGYNLFFVVAFPYLIAIIICGLMRKGELRQKLNRIVESKYLTYGYITLFFVWFVIRNIIDI